MHYDALERSATIVLAYLVEHEGLTLAEAVVKVFMIIDTVVLGVPNQLAKWPITKFTNAIHQRGS